jgi:hypothetical protein
MGQKLTLSEKLAKIQTELKTKKTRFNSFGKYYYRSAEDILEAIKPFLTKYKVSVRVNEKYLQDGYDSFPIIQSTAIVESGNENISASAIVGIDLEQKGMQMPQKFGTASSYGKKYALGNLFLIDDTQDADAINTHNKKPKLLANTPQFKNAQKALNDGKSIDQIKKHYILTEETEKQLLN